MLNCVSVWVCACVSMRGCVLVCMHLTPHPLPHALHMDASQQHLFENASPILWSTSSLSSYKIITMYMCLEKNMLSCLEESGQEHQN